MLSETLQMTLRVGWTYLVALLTKSLFFKMLGSIKSRGCSPLELRPISIK